MPGSKIPKILWRQFAGIRFATQEAVRFGGVLISKLEL
jgi:hypothetical protein